MGGWGGGGHDLASEICLHMMIESTKNKMPTKTRTAYDK